MQAKGMAEGTIGTTATLVGGLIGVGVLAYIGLQVRALAALHYTVCVLLSASGVCMTTRCEHDRW